MVIITAANIVEAVACPKCGAAGSRCQRAGVLVGAVCAARRGRAESLAWHLHKRDHTEVAARRQRNREGPGRR